MVQLLTSGQLRIISGILCFMSIGTIVAHVLVFILLMSNMESMAVPFSLMGQGVWTGSLTIGTASLLLAYANAKSKNTYDSFCMRGEVFASRSVLYMLICSFVTSLFGLLTDGYGCFTLASSEWFSTVGGVTLFGMLLIEFFLLLATNLLCFGLIAFTGDNKTALKREMLWEEERLRAQGQGYNQGQMNNSRSSAVWPSFTSPSDLYKIKSINYRNQTEKYSDIY